MGLLKINNALKILSFLKKIESLKSILDSTDMLQACPLGHHTEDQNLNENIIYPKFIPSFVDSISIKV